MSTRGIREVPTNIDTHTRNFLIDLRQLVVNLQATQAPPTIPSNLVVTSQAFSNLIQWTRSVNADYYEVLWNTTPATSGAHVINIGNSAQWVDQIGQSGITRYYWVRAARNNGFRSAEVGYKTGTTLVATAGVTPPPPPVQSQIQILDQRTGRTIPGDPNRPDIP